MTLVDKDKLQRDAASEVVAELGAVRFEERDVPGAPPGTRDFDIVFPDGHCEPLEVTTNFFRRAGRRSADTYLLFWLEAERPTGLAGRSATTYAGGSGRAKSRACLSSPMP